MGQLKITRQGELHRKSKKILEDDFTHGNHISASFGESEVKFIYQLSVENEWVNYHNEELVLSPKGRSLLQTSLQEIHFNIWMNWMRRKFHNNSEVFAYFFESPNPFDIGEMAKLFSTYGQHLPDYMKLSDEKSTSHSGLTWEQIPAVLQEMFMLGWIELGFTKGRVQILSADKKLSEEWDAHHKFVFEFEPAESPKCLPNFEFYLSPSAEPSKRQLCSAFAAKKNDEILTTYQFSKDSVLKGLLNGFEISDLESLLEWLEADEGINSSIRDWGNKFDSCRFLEGVVLEVKDSSHRESLSNHPGFKTIVISTLPEFGFIIKPGSENTAQEILNHMDLYPGFEIKIPEGEPLSKLIETTGLENIHEENPEIEYDFLEEKKALFVHSKTKYQTKVTKPSDLDKSRIIDYSIVADKLMELSFVGASRKRLLIRPIRLLKDVDPSKLIAIEMETGHRKEFEVNNITSLRAIE